MLHTRFLATATATATLATSLVLSACGPSPKAAESGLPATMDSIANIAKDSAANPEQPSANQGTGCFHMHKNGDVVTFSIQQEDGYLQGRMSHAFAGKDKSSGSVKGNMSGDTLIADYVFDAEGRKSVREVALLRIDDTWVEGFGPAEERNGKMVFISRRGLSFKNGLVLAREDCETMQAEHPAGN